MTAKGMFEEFGYTQEIIAEEVIVEMTLAEFVKTRRQERAMTQIELARKLGITNVSVSNIEKGNNIGPTILKKLSKYFKIETALLRAMMMEGKV